MRVTLLGTGTSTGVPMIGCECSVCTSADPRDRRLRTSALIETSTGNILIDAGPDMRYQLLRAGVQSLHGVLITHEHQDHIGGLDDLRPLNYRMQTSVALYSAEHTLAILRKRYHYAFEAQSGGSSRPNIDLISINPWQPFQLAGQTIIPLPITHGPMNILGYRIGQFAYITDASHIDDSVVDAVQGVDVLIINALRDQPHPMHLSFAQAQEYVERIGPRRAYFVHLSHDLHHADLLHRLPEYMQPGYDGQLIEVAE